MNLRKSVSAFLSFLVSATIITASFNQANAASEKKDKPKASGHLGSLVTNVKKEIKSPGFATTSQRSYNCSPNADTRTCMVCNCYYETRGEPTEGKVAISFAVLARASSGIKEYSSNVCKVIYQPAQFSWTRTNGSSIIRTSSLESGNRAGLNECEKTVDYSRQFSKVRGPMWFHATSVLPLYAKNKIFSATVGHHKFYTTKGQPFQYVGERLQTLARDGRISPTRRQGGLQ